MHTKLESPEAGHSAWEGLATPESVQRAVEALRENGFKAEVVADRKAALEKVQSLIPEGARVMTGGSKTLDEIGFTRLLASGSHPWVNLKGRLLSEPDAAKQVELRKQAIYADYFLGSVHAVTEAGQLVAGSATGSQIAGYAYGGENLILVAGTQKVTPDLGEALRRLREHSVPLEDKRMKELGAPGTLLSKILIYEKERRRNVHVILVNEKLGF
jgi:LUD domain